MIIRSLKELEINVQTTPIIIVGGGACVVKITVVSSYQILSISWIESERQGI